jgi:hypothetical protein
VRDEDEDELYHIQESEADDRTKDGCVHCEKGKTLVCIHGTHFGYCDEGCVEPRKLGEGMKCVEGRIFGMRMYWERRD